MLVSLSFFLGQVIFVQVNPGETFTIRGEDGTLQCIQGKEDFVSCFIFLSDICDIDNEFLLTLTHSAQIYKMLKVFTLQSAEKLSG